jgi:hypothetical protein
MIIQYTTVKAASFWSVWEITHMMFWQRLSYTYSIAYFWTCIYRLPKKSVRTYIRFIAFCFKLIYRGRVLLITLGRLYTYRYRPKVLPAISGHQTRGLHRTIVRKSSLICTGGKMMEKKKTLMSWWAARLPEINFRLNWVPPNFLLTCCHSEEEKKKRDYRHFSCILY